MKQKATRILSLVLSFTLLFSVLAVYAAAANNFVPDEEYYDNVHLTSVIVSPDWDGYKNGDKITYNFRGKSITETFDDNIHFSSIQDAFDASVKSGDNNPTIVLTPGVYTENAVIPGDVTIIGPNGGINPNKESKSADVPWKENTNRYDEAILKCVLFVGKKITTNVEINIDGVYFSDGFSFMETASRETETIVKCENTIIDDAGNASYNATFSASDVFSFEHAIGLTSTVTIKNVLVKNMNSASVVGKGITNFTASNVFFTESSNGFIGMADATTNLNPNYLVKDSMFYNNTSSNGIIALDHSLNDNTTRTTSDVEIANCSFIDGINAIDNSVAPIYIKLVGSKNNLNVHDCYFLGQTDYAVPVIDIDYTSDAMKSEFKNNIRFNNNVAIGFTLLPDTTGLTPFSSYDFTGNYYADSNFKQCDPVFPSLASYKNIYMDYFYVNEKLTIPTTYFNIKSFGVEDAQIDHKTREVYATIPYGGKFKVNISKNHSDTTIKLYGSDKKTVYKEIDTTKLVQGQDKNIFYAVSTSTKYPSYSCTYKVYISVFNHDKAIEFKKANAFLLDKDVAKLKKGDAYYRVWDGIPYKFTVGKNAFATLGEIYDAVGEESIDNVPTVMMPSGTFSGTLHVTRSTILLGAKHGIDPNIRQFENPDREWLKNPERAQSDQETVLENAAIVFDPENTYAFIEVDGFTFGPMSAFADNLKLSAAYTTKSYLKNNIFDNAGNVSYTTSTGISGSLKTIISVNANTTMISPEQSLYVINARMEDNTSSTFLSGVMSNLTLDGCYFANNNGTLSTGDLTACNGRDFRFKIVNSCFYKNVTSSPYFIVNNNKTSASTARKISLLLIDNSTFYETTSYAHGIFGIRFNDKRDAVSITNSNFISSTSSSLMPGHQNWFIGKSGYKKTVLNPNYNLLDPITNFVLKNNRIIGTCIGVPSVAVCSPKTLLDYSQNYFASSYGKKIVGIKAKTDQERVPCDSYYLDWDMKNLYNASSAYNKELNFEFVGADNKNKTFKDTVSDTATEYSFDINMQTKQASYSVYTDKAMTNEVLNPAPLKAGKNVFYVKFSSYDGTVNKVYTATITKPACKKAVVEQFGNYKVDTKNIYAYVPTGTTVFTIPEIVASVGAKVTVYNNSACTQKFTGTEITGIGKTATYKYIKVVSEDGNTTKKYKLSVVQGKNPYAEIISIDGATKKSDTSFVVNIDKPSFIVSAQLLSGAKMSVYDDGVKLNQNSETSVIVDNISSSKTVSIQVVSQTGAKKTYSLKIVNGKTSATVKSIQDMYNVSGNTSSFETTTKNNYFVVQPTLTSNFATYKVYRDAECTDELVGGVIVLKDYITDIYLKVTSADKKTSNVSRLTIVSDALKASDGETSIGDYLKVKNSELIQDSTNVFNIEVPAGTKKYTIEFDMINPKHIEYSTYNAYSDKGHEVQIASSKKISQSLTVNLESRNNRFYFYAYIYADKTTAVKSSEFIVNVIVKQPSVTYKDSSKIPSWAKDEVDYLNKNGYAYFVGDNGKFNPTSNISRFEVAVVVAKLLGVNVKAYSNYSDLTFKDKIPSWAGPYVKAVNKLGIMSGKSETNFDGYANTTREEFSRIMVGTILVAQNSAASIESFYEEYKVIIDYMFSMKKFKDTSKISSWALSSVKLATVYYNVMSGSLEGGKLYINPKKAITRQEVAVLVANYEGYNAK